VVLVRKLSGGVLSTVRNVARKLLLISLLRSAMASDVWLSKKTW
jgi:hypothetical protein